jgi:putative transposase
MLKRDTPEYIRSDNGSEFIAVHAELLIAPMYITLESLWENGYCESFNGRMADELFNLEIFDAIQEARILLSRWVNEYNTALPHSALGYRSPAPKAILYVD